MTIYYPSMRRFFQGEEDSTDSLRSLHEVFGADVDVMVQGWDL